MRSKKILLTSLFVLALSLWTFIVINPDLAMSTIGGVTNVLGEDTSDNAFASTNVAANRDGSIIERLEHLLDALVDDETTNLIGYNDANNAAVTTSVAANEDGSVLERLEQLQEGVNKGAGAALPTGKSLFDIIGETYTDDGGADHLDDVASHLNLLSKYVADGDGDFATGSTLPANKSIYDITGAYTADGGADDEDTIMAHLDLIYAQTKVTEATGEADIDISESDYTGFINIMTITAPATGLNDCRVDLDLNKTTTGWDAVSTAADTIDIALVGQTDGTNYRNIQNATQIAANGDETLEMSENGVSFHIGPMQANGSIQIHVKLSVERDDAELPYRVTYIGAAPTITPVAIP